MSKLITEAVLWRESYGEVVSWNAFELIPELSRHLSFIPDEYRDSALVEISHGRTFLKGPYIDIRVTYKRADEGGDV